MLVHSSSDGTRKIFDPKSLAEAIVLCAFPHLPDPELSAVPFVQLKTAEDGSQYYFSYENQFTIGFKQFDNRYEFSPNWHAYHEKALELEKAVAILQDHLFKQVGPARGF